MCLKPKIACLPELVSVLASVLYIISCFFLSWQCLQGWFEENPKALLTAKDSQGNTLAHLAAVSGNTEVFQVKHLWKLIFFDYYAKRWQGTLEIKGAHD